MIPDHPTDLCLARCQILSKSVALPLCHAMPCSFRNQKLVGFVGLSESILLPSWILFLQGFSWRSSFSWSQADISFKPWSPRLVLQHCNWHHHPLFAACVWAQVGELNELRRLVRKEVHGDAVGASACTNPHEPSPATDSRERMTLTKHRQASQKLSFPFFGPFRRKIHNNLVVQPRGQRGKENLYINLFCRSLQQQCLVLRVPWLLGPSDRFEAMFGMANVQPQNCTGGCFHLDFVVAHLCDLDNALPPQKSKRSISKDWNTPNISK